MEYGCLREFADRARTWIPIFARPVLPATAELLPHRLEQREGARRADLRPGIPIDEAKDVRLQRGDAGVIHERRLAQLVELALECFRLHQALRCRALLPLRQCLEVQVEEIEGEPARRAVGTALRGV